MKKSRLLGAACACLTILSFNTNAAIVSFDDGGGTQDGELLYGGINNGLLNGSGIDFHTITGIGTLNDNTLDCIGCELSFQTGPNVTEGPSIWTFGAGAAGSVQVVGSVPTLGLTDAILLQGSFSQATVEVAGGGVLLSLTAFGWDRKASEILNYFGLEQGFDSVSTAISLGDILYDGDACERCEEGAFKANVVNADLNNLGTVVPVPAAVWLFGSGLLGLVGLARRKKSA